MAAVHRARAEQCRRRRGGRLAVAESGHTDRGRRHGSRRLGGSAVHALGIAVPARVRTHVLRHLGPSVTRDSDREVPARRRWLGGGMGKVHPDRVELHRGQARRLNLRDAWLAALTTTPPARPQIIASEAVMSGSGPSATERVVPSLTPSHSDPASAVTVTSAANTPPATTPRPTARTNEVAERPSRRMPSRIAA